MKKIFFYPFLFICIALQAKKAPLHHFIEVDSKQEIQSPWLTGPLLAPSGVTIPVGHYNIEPYLYVTANTGKYGHDWKVEKTTPFWNNYFQTSFQVGITNWADFQLNPTLYYNVTKHASQWSFGDMPIGFDFQLYKRGEKITDWITGVKLALKETLPFGKYQNLDPHKKGTDVAGGGSWQTGIGIVWGNLFYLGGTRFLTGRFSFQYNLPAPVHVKNLNAYGGARGTRGTVYPGQSFQFDIGTELTLTKHWALACDLVGSWSGKTRFKGKTLVSNTAPPSTQFSIAPAIEYNWNGNLGIIFGPWLTIAGRNAVQFASGVFALNYYH